MQGAEWHGELAGGAAAHPRKLESADHRGRRASTRGDARCLKAAALPSLGCRSVAVIVESQRREEADGGDDSSARRPSQHATLIGDEEDATADVLVSVDLVGELREAGGARRRHRRFRRRTGRGREGGGLADVFWVGP